MDVLSKEIKEQFADRDTSLVDTLNSWFRYMPDQFHNHGFLKYNFEKKKLETVNVSAEDIANLSEEELNKKYNFKGRLNQFLSRQRKKSAVDPSGLSRFIVGSMTWMVFLLLPLMAGLFKIFFRKKDHYFVEHLVFLFHVHSFTLLLATIM